MCKANKYVCVSSCVRLERGQRKKRKQDELVCVPSLCMWSVLCMRVSMCMREVCVGFIEEQETASV